MVEGAQSDEDHQGHNEEDDEDDQDQDEDVDMPTATTKPDPQLQQQQQQQQHHRLTKPKSGGIAADASFLETLDQTSTTSSSSVLELHRSNLLRLQAEQLVTECQLVASPSSGSIGNSSSSSNPPSWTSQVGPYVEIVSSILDNITLQKKDSQELTSSCPFVFQSDHTAERCLESLLAKAKVAKSKARGNNNNNNNKAAAPLLHVLPFLPPSQQQHQQQQHGIVGRGSCGLTKASGNANVLPTFTVVVRLANTLWDSKDYLKHRYFDKRKLIVWYVAQQLTQNKKFRAKVGTVYWKYDHHDVRKPCLILVPPTRTSAAATSTSPATLSKKKKSKLNHTATTTTTTTKSPKFRIQILFEMESIEWIPPLRLVPNRSNLPQQRAVVAAAPVTSKKRKEKKPATTSPTTKDVVDDSTGSPMYNHALLEDAYHTAFLPTTNTEHTQSRSSSSSNTNDDDGGSGSDDSDDNDEHYPHWMDTVILAKIWCLQRGLLRAHDGFTTDHLALLILYLYRTRQANARMGPLQVLAALFKCLGETRWFSSSDQINNGGVNGDGKSNNANLSRQSPSEASSFYGSAANSSKQRRKKRAVLVLPSLGRTEAQTIAHSSLAKLYAKQTKESPLTSEDPATLVALYQKICPGPVLLDSSLRFNYFERISPNFMNMIQVEASKSLQYLHSPSNSSPQEALSMVADKPFVALFMSPARFWNRHDLYFKIPLSHFRKEAATETCQSQFSPHCCSDLGDYEALARAVMSVLRQALGDRVVSIQIVSNGNGLLDQEASKAPGQSFVDSDQVPIYEIQKGHSEPVTTTSTRLSPRGDDSIVLGVSLNTDTCHRIVDRGPPAEDGASIHTFVDLWGNKAELRRFKDGAIVQAVVWNTMKNEPGTNDKSYVRYQNEDAMQGGIVERIVNVMLHRHFLSPETVSREKSISMSPLRDLASIIDGVALGGAVSDDNSSSPWFSNPTLAHRNILKSFEELASFLREHSLPTLPVPGSLEEKTSRLGMPLAIDAVEPLSQCLRYSDLFPPLPHPFLGSPGVKGLKKTSGVITSEPVCIQIRFGASSKWPTDLKAIGAAKTAMLVQLADGIEGMQERSRGECDGFAASSITVTPSYLDVGFRGYMFRIKVRSDPEIRLLRGLFRPSIEAAALLRDLTRDSVVSAMHHSMIHAIHTKHASAGGVVRLATRWVAGHMLSGLIPPEAIEMMVARVYSDRNSPLDAPGSVSAGFLRFLQLLETHDWVREPLIVDPHGHIGDEDRTAILARFEQIRGPKDEAGPPMYIISPSDREGIDDVVRTPTDATQQKQSQQTPPATTASWTPSSTTTALPEWVILTRLIALARKSRTFLMSKVTSFESTGDNNSWSAAFHETANSFKAYSALLRIDSDFATDEPSSSTGTHLGPTVASELKGTGSSTALSKYESAYTKSMQERYLGPKALRLKLYRNMRNDAVEEQVLQDWRPVDALVKRLRQEFGSLAIFFYNHLCPDLIAVLWRPHVFSTQPFSVMASEYMQPSVSTNWKSDTMVLSNTDDLIREMRSSLDGIVTKVKVFQSPSPETSTIVGTVSPPISPQNKRKHADDAASSSDEDDNSM